MPAASASIVTTILSVELERRGLAQDDVLGHIDSALAEITGSAVTRLGGAMVSWTDDPFARCIARAPIGDKRETALPGEHTDERPGPGGMDGAIRSGLRVVDEITGARPATDKYPWVPPPGFDRWSLGPSTSRH